jgi:hypothetical protein
MLPIYMDGCVPHKCQNNWADFIHISCLRLFVIGWYPVNMNILAPKIEGIQIDLQNNMVIM